MRKATLILLIALVCLSGTLAKPVQKRQSEEEGYSYPRPPNPLTLPPRTTTTTTTTTTTKKPVTGYVYTTPRIPFTFPTRPPKTTTTSPTSTTTTSSTTTTATTTITTTATTTTTTTPTTTTTTSSSITSVKYTTGYVYSTPKVPLTLPPRRPATTTTPSTTTTLPTTTTFKGYVITSPENPLTLPPRVKTINAPDQKDVNESDLPPCLPKNIGPELSVPGVNCKLVSEPDYVYADYTLEVQESDRSVGLKKDSFIPILNDVDLDYSEKEIPTSTFAPSTTTTEETSTSTSAAPTTHITSTDQESINFDTTFTTTGFVSTSTTTAATTTLDLNIGEAQSSVSEEPASSQVATKESLTTLPPPTVQFFTTREQTTQSSDADIESVTLPSLPPFEETERNLDESKSNDDGGNDNFIEYDYNDYGLLPAIDIPKFILSSPATTTVAPEPTTPLTTPPPNKVSEIRQSIQDITKKEESLGKIPTLKTSTLETSDQARSEVTQEHANSQVSIHNLEGIEKAKEKLTPTELSGQLQDSAGPLFHGHPEGPQTVLFLSDPQFIPLEDGGFDLNNIDINSIFDSGSQQFNIFTTAKPNADKKANEDVLFKVDPKLLLSNILPESEADNIRVVQDYDETENIVLDEDSEERKKENQNDISSKTTAATTPSTTRTTILPLKIETTKATTTTTTTTTTTKTTTTTTSSTTTNSSSSTTKAKTPSFLTSSTRRPSTDSSGPSMPPVMNERAALVDMPPTFEGSHEVPILMNNRAMVPDLEELNNVVLFEVVNGVERRKQKPVKTFPFQGRDFNIAAPLG